MSRFLPFCNALFSVTLILFLLIAAPAHAKIDKEGAEKLKKIFSEMLEHQKTEGQARGGKLLLEGDILVEPAGKYYAVTLPHISLLHADNSKLEIGIIAVNALPGDKPDHWKMTMAMPSPITYFDDTGKPELVVDIGSQNLAGIWHEKMKSFFMLRAQYKDMKIKDSDSGVFVEVPNTKIIYDLKEDANGNWTGPIKLEVFDTTITEDNNPGKSKIGKMWMDMELIDYSLDAALNYQDKIEALAESYEAGDSPSISGPHLIAIYNLVTEFMMNSWGGFTMTMGVNDINIKRPPIPGSPEGFIKLNDAAMAFDMTGFRKNDVTLRTAFSYNGMEIQPRPEKFNDAAPTNLNMDLKIRSLPFKELVNLGKTSIEAGMSNPQMASMIGLQAAMSIPQLITQAGTNLYIENSYLGNDEYHVKIDGTLTANIKAMFGATGETKLEVSGLDNLINALKTDMEQPDISDDKKAKLEKDLKILTVMQLTGQQAKDDKGNPVRTYTFTLDEQGKTLMNGTDIKALIDQTK